MPRRLLALNVVLAGVLLLGLGYIVLQLARAPAPTVLRRPQPPSAPAPPPAEVPSPVPPPATAGIASRNLFSPTRSEATAAVGPATASLAKPILYGVVLREGAPIAYLEDPATKRTASYRVGDQIAGGTVQAIDADQVVLASPSGPVNVRLRDPSKPRAPSPPQPAVPGRPAQPTVVPPGATPPLPAPGATIPPRVSPVPGFPPPQRLPGQPGALVGPGMRPSPSFGRFPPVPRATDASRQ